MYPINQWETSCSSPVVTTATPSLLPCKNDTDIVAVSMEPRTWSNRGTLFPDSYCSHSLREAGAGRERRGLNVLTGKALEGTLRGSVCAKSHSLCLLGSSEERALNTTQSHLWAFSNLWQLKASLEIRAKTTRISSGESMVALRTADRQCFGMDNFSN